MLGSNLVGVGGSVGVLCVCCDKSHAAMWTTRLPEAQLWTKIGNPLLVLPPVRLLVCAQEPWPGTGTSCRQAAETG